MPVAMPMPKAVDQDRPSPRSSPPSGVATKIGPSAETAPTAAKAIDDPRRSSPTRWSPRGGTGRRRGCRARSATGRAAPRPREARPRIGTPAHHERPRTRTSPRPATAPATPGASRSTGSLAERLSRRRRGREHRAAERQRRRTATTRPIEFAFDELPPRHQVGQRRVARRRPQQREALDQERQEEDRPTAGARKAIERVQRAARDVGARS